jgi:hypothetical protein
VEHGFQVIQVLIESVTINNDIVNVNQTTYPLQAAQHKIHISLERSWCVGKAIGICQ